MSFSATAEAETETGSPAIVETGESLAKVSAPDNGLQGEISQTDIRLPRINFVQKMSELAEAFKFGDIVFEKTIKIGDLENPVSMTVLRLRKQFQQDLPYGSEDMPQVFNTSEEVREAGGSVVRGSGNYFSEIAHIQVAIKAPDTIGEEELEFFPYNFKGSDYAMAMITVSRSAYSTLAKPIITHGFNSLRDGLFNGKFELHVDLKKSPKGSYVVPVPVFKGRHDEETVEFLKGLL
jgi:hypothetical protein